MASFSWGRGSGTGSPPIVVGDTGAGGVAGLAPAPSAGDTAANKFLKADATWSVVPAVGTWTNYAPTISPIGGFTIAPNGFYKVIGDTLFVMGGFVKDGSVGGGGTLTLGLPSGYTINTASLPNTAGARAHFGTVSSYNLLLTTAYDRALPIIYNAGTSSVSIIKSGATGFIAGTDVKAGAEVYWTFSVPI